MYAVCEQGQPSSVDNGDDVGDREKEMEAADDERASERGSLDDDNGSAAVVAATAIAVNTSNEAVTLVRQCITD